MELASIRRVPSTVWSHGSSLMRLRTRSRLQVLPTEMALKRGGFFVLTHEKHSMMG